MSHRDALQCGNVECEDHIVSNPLPVHEHANEARHLDTFELLKPDLHHCMTADMMASTTNMPKFIAFSESYQGRDEAPSKFQLVQPLVGMQPGQMRDAVVVEMESLRAGRI